MSARDSPAGEAKQPRTSRASIIVPVAIEDAIVKTRRRERGRVRIAKTVETEDQEVSGTARVQEVLVERVAIDRFVERPAGARQEGDTLVIPVFEEVPVVVMKLKLKEEIRVTRRTASEERRMPVTLRRERVTVERVGAAELQESETRHK
ncbi:DUF2382 domain-containing protein [Nitrospira moscoviensis]|uniref:DUF2382 domain-containing protein n=1 Tax=Nitrospira moscoviensis TaxID=42253 RepID=A0A0K2GDV2_NITMO|nr:DUF2382 domain-containing protein [Nitrospira moscoviensis]ALA59128.1 hypothetical protein NITMOv2_2717 [Nitrospira moscoviensis]